MAKQARKAKLKVFRTPAGFHDAYVAAPSRKAALEAWGAETNLFAAGAAEPVTDPELTREPLARPGVVIRKLRGSEREHIAALGKTGAAKAKNLKAASPTRSPPRARPRRPSRAALGKAEAALAAHELSLRKAVETLRRQEEAIARRRRELEGKGAVERRRLENRVDEERALFADAQATSVEPDR